VHIALNCHNVEYALVERFARMTKNPAKRWYAFREARHIRVAEWEACRRVSAAMVCSHVDGELLKELRPNLPIQIVPNAVDSDYYYPSKADDSAGCAPILLFQGSMDWYPNRDAVEFFVVSIFPKILQEFPKAKFVVAGRNPPAEFLRKFSTFKGVEFTGTVPDMRPYLAAATLVVVPLRIGGGTRIKILEASAAGKATVSTTIGAEGLDLQNEKELVLADDAPEFARAVSALVRDSRRRTTISRAARARVTQDYSLVALRKSLEQFLSIVVPHSMEALASEVAN